MGRAGGTGQKGSENFGGTKTLTVRDPAEDVKYTAHFFKVEKMSDDEKRGETVSRTEIYKRQGKPNLKKLRPHIN